MDYNLKKAYTTIYDRENYKPKITLAKSYDVIKEDYSIFYKKPNESKYKYIGDVESQDLTKVQKVINAGRGKHDVIPYLKTKNYTRDTFKNPNSFDGLVELLATEEWTKFIITDKKPLISQNKVGNIGSIATKYDVSSDSVRVLADFQATDAGGSNIGPGEILLSVLFGDVENSTTGGDLVNSTTGGKIEVKGQLGRFGQQGGRSSQGVSFDVLNNQLQQKITGIEQNMSVSLTMVVFHGSFKKEGKEKMFLPAVKEFFKTLYPKADYETILTSPAIFSNKVSARQAVDKLYVSNYVNKYDFEQFLFIDKTDLDYVIFTPEDVLMKGGYIDSGKLKINSIRFNDPYPTIFYKF